MSIIEYYLLFSISVGFWSCYEILLPALYSLKNTDPSDVLVKNKLITYLVHFVFSGIFAPIMVYIILSPNLCNKLITAITNKK